MCGGAADIPHRDGDRGLGDETKVLKCMLVRGRSRVEASLFGKVRTIKRRVRQSLDASHWRDEASRKASKISEQEAFTTMALARLAKVMDDNWDGFSRSQEARENR